MSITHLMAKLLIEKDLAFNRLDSIHRELKNPMPLIERVYVKIQWNEERDLYVKQLQDLVSTLQRIVDGEDEESEKLSLAFLKLDLYIMTMKTIDDGFVRESSCGRRRARAWSIA